MTRLCNECHLYDAVVDKHIVTDFTTYQRGTAVLDYILIDDNIRRTINATGYEPFGIHILSDHRGVYIDVSTSHCIGDSIQPMAPIILRDLSTKRPHQIQPYFVEKDKHLLDHNWYTKIELLECWQYEL